MCQKQIIKRKRKYSAITQCKLNKTNQSVNTFTAPK